MCLAVYVASDVPLPESKWNEQAPAVYLQPVPESAAVRRQFSLQHVYYAGSHEGCGCGFRKRGTFDQEWQQCQDNYRQLADALSSAVRHGARVQIFTCWEGDQATAPDRIGVVTLQELVEPPFELEELSLLHVQSPSLK